MASKGSPINYIGVDVGTRSVRAGLFSSEGKLLAYNTCDIKLWTNEGFHEGSFEQSTSNIWTALCTTIQVIFLLRNRMLGNVTGCILVSL